MRSAAEPPMSAAEQFKNGVPERSGPKDWRGGLQRSRGKAGLGGDAQQLVTVCASNIQL